MNKLQPLYINTKILKKHDACAYARRSFSKTFGAGANVLVTKPNFRKAVEEAQLPPTWLAEKYAQHLGVHNYEEVGRIDSVEDPTGDHTACDAHGNCLGCQADARAQITPAWNEIQRLRRIAAKQAKEGAR
jgi:hypothetical protein